MFLSKFPPVAYLLFSLSLTSCGGSTIPTYKPVDGNAGGCGRDYFYRLSKDESTAVGIRIDRSMSQFTNSDLQKTYTASTPGVSAQLLLFSERATGYFCSGVSLGIEPTTTWSLKQGTITTKKVDATCFVDAAFDKACKASATLQNAIFQKNGSQEVINIDYLEINDVLIGWLPI